MKFEDFQAHDFCSDYAFEPGSSGELRPAGHRLRQACALEQHRGTVSLKIGKAALAHPTFASALNDMLHGFVKVLLEGSPSPTELEEAVRSGGSVKANSRSVLIEHDSNGYLRLTPEIKSKSRFWPFRRS